MPEAQQQAQEPLREEGAATAAQAATQASMPAQTAKTPASAAKPRPKAKTPQNKATKRRAADEGADVARGMRGVIKPGRKKRSAGKPSVFDEAEPGAKSSRGIFGGLTPRLMLELAAPHTWAASIMPVYLAMCLAAADEGQISSLMVIVLLLISVLMQSAVNTFNDYQDFVKGTDTRDNQDDPTDAVLVYNDVEPYGARNLAAAFIVVAFLLGIYVIANAGWIPLAIALIGVAVIFLYSGGPRPLSYTPAGELVSGFVMGGLITFACYIALAGTLSWAVLVESIPPIIGIALIMFTNNTCDIEKDRKAARATLAVSLGRKDSVILYHGLVLAWLVAIALLVVVFHPTGSLGLLFLLASVPPVMGLFRNPFTPASRQAAMSAITSTNVVLGFAYGAAVLLSGVIVVVA